jgi:hypothetical protein
MASRSDRLQTLLDGLYDQERLAKLGLGAERKIRKRTRKGISVNRTPFPRAQNPRATEDSDSQFAGSPYSDSWARERREKGLTIKKKTLKYTLRGGMMAKMTHKVLQGSGEKGALLYFEGERAEQLARWHNVEGVGTNHMKHRFFGLNEKERGAIRDLFVEEINDLINLADLT